LKKKIPEQSSTVVNPAGSTLRLGRGVISAKPDRSQSRSKPNK